MCMMIKYRILSFALFLTTTCPLALADISGADIEPCKFYRTFTDAVCDAQLSGCLNNLTIPIFYDPQFYNDLMYCYEEDQYCRTSGIEICDPDPNAEPPPPEEPPPGWDTPVETTESSSSSSSSSDEYSSYSSSSWSSSSSSY